MRLGAGLSARRPPATYRAAGTIPAELSGTLLRNGPALFEIGNQAIPQPFDGDGMAAMFGEWRDYCSTDSNTTEHWQQS